MAYPLGTSAARVHAIAILAFATLAPSQLVGRWTLLPELRLREAANAYAPFTYILSIIPLSDGSAWVADARSQQLVQFKADGQHAQTLGGPGRGPGQFGRIGAIGLLGDTLWATDGNLRRTTLFSSDGEVLSTIRTAVELIPQPDSMVLTTHLTALLPDGMALGGASGAGMREMTARDLATPAFRMTREGAIVDTLTWLSTKNQIIALSTDANGIVFGSQRFSDTPLTVIAAAVSRLFVIDRTVAIDGRNAAFGVVAISASGDTLWSRRYSYAPERLPHALADSVLDTAERSFRAAGRTRAEIREALFLPDYYPPVSSAFAAVDGSLWLRRNESTDSTAYSIIAPDGELIAEISVPAAVTLMAATPTHAWGVETDVFDVPTVIRYEIRK